MTDALTLTDPERDDLQAAEYVLGVLPLPDRIIVETRIKSDPTFAATVTAWENRLSGLNDAYDPVPAPNLLPQIEARLFGQPAKPRRRWAGWLAGAFTAAALVVAVIAVLPVTQAPTLGTTLAADTGDLRYQATLAGNTLTVPRVSGTPAEPGRVHELLLIAGSAAPVPLGLIEGDSLVLQVSAAAAGAVLAISLEPTGGSPTGAPTGPVLVTGVLSDI